MEPRVRAPGLKPDANPAHAVIASTADIDLVSVEVRSELDKQLLYDIPLQGGATSASLSLPVGEGTYSLVVRGYDRYGQETHEGSTYVSYVGYGANKPFAVDLKPVIDGASAASVQFDLNGEERSGGGIQFFVKAKQSVLQGQTMNIQAQVVDAYGNAISLKPGDLHWALSDPRAGRLMPNPEKAGSAALLANQGGSYYLWLIYKNFPYRWPIFVTVDPYVQISAGFDFACGIRSSGALYCWGSNYQQGLGVVTAPNTCYPSPTYPTSYATNCSVQPIRVAGSRLFSRVTTGWGHACAIEAGTSDTFCWGNNYDGELGIGSKGSYQTPVMVAGGHKFQQVSAGETHTCGIENGTAFCWGSNYWGQLGVGSYGQNNNPSTGYLTVTEQLTPGPVPNYGGWSQITAGQEFNCGLNGGGVLCWGMYNEGEIGIGNSFGGTTDAPRGVIANWAPATISSLSVGSITTTMCAITNAGAAWCWGSNQGEKLGAATSPGLSAGAPVPVQGGHSFLSIANGTYHTCAIDNANQVFCWGYELDGRTGFPSAQVSNAVPTVVSVSGQTFSSVVAGNRFSCALTTFGRIYCWGSNLLAQLGNGTSNVGSNIPSLVWGS